MDIVLIYISYDSIDHINCFNLSINNNLVCEEVPIERSDELFLKCNEIQISKTETQWCIVSDVEASKWDYEAEICSYGYTLNPYNTSWEELYKIMDEVFNCNCIISTNDDKTKRRIKIIYPDSLINSKTDKSQEEAVNVATRVLDGAGMTELARIIREKYERIGKNG